MKDRIMIVGVIVAAHLVVISLFIFSGGNDSDPQEMSQRPPDIEDVPELDLPDPTITDVSDVSVDRTPQDILDGLHAELNGEPTTGPNGQKTYVVQPGDSLSRISQKVYGTGRHYRYIFQANKDTLKSPEAVRPGQTLIIPPAP